MTPKQTTMILVGAVAVAALVYAFRQATADATPPERVTRTDKGGLVTSPINSSRVAVLTNPFRVAIDFFARNAANLQTAITGSLASLKSGDPMARQGNSESAVAAAVAPLRSDYRAKIDPALRNAKPVEISRDGNSFQFN